MLYSDEETFTRDVGPILAAQKVEHYEIACYGIPRHACKQTICKHALVHTA
ncbi:MAG TPA: DUF892 family protein [Flavisolibacter sp.]